MRLDPLLVRPGALEVHVGPMFSGKSDVLFTLEDQLRFTKGDQMGAFKPLTDNSTEGIYSRLRRMELSSISINPSVPEEILDHVKNYHSVIAIDEAQFFPDGEVLGDVINFLRRQGKHIVVDGLSSDWTRAPFGAIPYITAMPGAEIFTHRAICNSCGGPADYTQRLINGEPAPYESGKQVEVDKERGLEIKEKPLITYQARCFQHHELPGTPKDYRF